MEGKANVNGGGKTLEELLGLQVGVIGSPSSTSRLMIDILDAAASRKLLGELVIFPFMQDNLPHYAIGQMTEIQTDEDGAVRCPDLEIKAVFCRTGSQVYEPGMLGTVPPTGTPVYSVSDEIFKELLRSYHREGLFYLGYVNDMKTKLPLWFRHFGSGEGGAGGPYNLGIFGKTGSGKSVLARMILLAYARHPQMSILVIDPQGEFSKALRGKATGDFYLPLNRLLKKLGKELVCLEMRSVFVDQRGTFERLLFESTLGGPPGAVTVSEALEWFWVRNHRARPILVLDLSGEQFKSIPWSELLQRLVVKTLLEEIISVSESSFLEGGRDLNTLILVEEVHRFAPRKVLNDEVEAEESLGGLFVDAVRATRKFGVGWLFTGNTLAGLFRGLVREIQVFFLGFGLGLGEDTQVLWDLIGPEHHAWVRYRGLMDPRSNPSRKQYPFMTVGSVSPLSFTGTPFFFDAFNSVEEFLKANGLSGEKA
ncbi:MAG: DUF87 domain-containing protein [Candidatus Hadarchaeales archaeon]